MPVDLNDLLASPSTAIVSLELQRSVVGDLSALPDLVRDAAPILPTVKSLMDSARRSGVPVVHCLVGPPVRGGRPNYPLASALAKRRTAESADPATGHDPVPDIGPADEDFRIVRHHGMSPFTGTELDALLRSLGVTTVVGCGVSLNVGMIGLAVEAVALGYRVVIPSDCVAGTPADFGVLVLQHSLRMLATISNANTIAGVWAA